MPKPTSVKRARSYVVCLDRPGQPETVISTHRTRRTARGVADRLGRQVRDRYYPDRPPYSYYVREQ